MKKKLLWGRSGNKCIVDTGCKTFDRYIDSISTGNVWGRGQYSSYIRPRSETECNGRVNPPGCLQDFDLKPFIERGLPRRMLEYIKGCKEQVILYNYYHYRGGQRINHGFILTTGKYNQERHLMTCVTGITRKSHMVLEAMKEYICEPEKVEA